MLTIQLTEKLHPLIPVLWDYLDEDNMGCIGEAIEHVAFFD